MPIPGGEDLFHFFFKPEDFEEKAGVGVRVRSNKFRTRGHTLSFNRGSIWPASKHLELAEPRGFGVCSVTANELRNAFQQQFATTNQSPIEIDPDPILEPEVDQLLLIPNPSHASVNRVLTQGEARRVADAASRQIHRVPG